ncbi:MAG: hypothetical protein K2X67_03915 [Burkholderiales bacterium]|nr:hypothetical protein [Burkholderiales bacterium]
MGTRNKLLWAANALALAATVTFAPGAWALYVGMYAIGDNVPVASGGCGGDDRPSWPGMAQAWWDEMGAKGHYQGPAANRYKYVDGNMIVRRFCDPQFDADCRDYQSSYPAGVDWMDAAIIATHGWDDGDHWGGIMRWPDPAVSNECALRFGGSSTQSRWGDSYLMFVIASSCQSADDDNLNGIRFRMQDTATSSSRRMHQFDGFHGIMYISSSFNGDYKETAKDGHSGSIANAWVTNHFKNNSVGCAGYDPWNWFGTCQDQCPIAYSIGSSGADAQYRLLNERYNYTFSDPTSVNYYWYMYYEGCNPVGENTFGSAD